MGIFDPKPGPFVLVSASEHPLTQEDIPISIQGTKIDCSVPGNAQQNSNQRKNAS